MTAYKTRYIGNNNIITVGTGETQIVITNIQDIQNPVISSRFTQSNAVYSIEIIGKYAISGLYNPLSVSVF